MDIDTSNSLVQDKVLILYVLSNMKHDITESNLFKLISPVNDINYFYFKQILTDLVDSKLVKTYTKDNENNQIIYELTENGKNSLDLTLDVLPGLIKLKIDTILKNEIANLISEDSIITECTPEDDQSYTVKCKIVDNNKTIFEIKVYAGSNDYARFIADNWKNNAYTLYPKILNLLTEEK